VIRYERDGELLVAVAEVVVGVHDVGVRVALGPWAGPLPDAGGVRELPVVLLSDDVTAALAAAGATRSGRIEPLVTTESAETPAALLTAAAEAAIVSGSTPSTAMWVRGLGGRPLPALPLDDADAAAAFIDALEVDVDVPIPNWSHAARAEARAALVGARSNIVHHLVEVDPRPAFEELGLEIEGASLSSLTAAAAGVLAGRVAAGNRRWRSPT
jgi:hypothetical protein